jgi:hypothetical protein
VVTPQCEGGIKGEIKIKIDDTKGYKIDNE